MTTELTKAAQQALKEAHMLILPIPAPEVSALDLAKAVSERATKIATLLTAALTQRPAAQSEAQALAHNMMLWREDAVHHGNEYVPVHVRTLEKVITQLRDMPAPQQATSHVETDWISNVIRDVSELPDRSSPDDEPDMMLVTAAELRSILETHAPQQATPASEAPDEHRSFMQQFDDARANIAAISQAMERSTPQQATPEPVVHKCRHCGVTTIEDEDGVTMQGLPTPERPVMFDPSADVPIPATPEPVGEGFDALMESLRPLLTVMEINDTDTLSAKSHDEKVIWTASGSWTGVAKLTLGDLRRICAAAAGASATRPAPGVPESPCQLRKRFEQHMRDVFACKDTAFLSIDGGKTYLDGSMDNHWRTWLAAQAKQ